MVDGGASEETFAAGVFEIAYLQDYAHKLHDEDTADNEQQDFVSYRLERYQAGVRMDFDETDPAGLAQTIAANIGKPVNYHPVNTGGAQKAASMILGLL